MKKYLSTKLSTEERRRSNGRNSHKSKRDNSSHI